jgi:hypothetical protein
VCARSAGEAGVLEREAALLRADLDLLREFEQHDRVTIEGRVYPAQCAPFSPLACPWQPLFSGLALFRGGETRLLDVASMHYACMSACVSS